jgi:indolepyruvate ferredoxin oxidoreductase
VLDVTGLAQKNGPVTSHVRVAARPDQLHATRIAAGAADLVIGCDIVVAASPENLAKLAPGRSAALINSHVAPTFEFASKPDMDLSGEPLRAALRAGAGTDACHFVDATRLATALLGDAIFTNPFLLGYALQMGRLPVSLEALERAIELNGRAIEANKRALAWGRLAAHDLAAVQRAAQPPSRGSAPPEADTLEALIERRAAFLTQYQDAAYAARYRALVERVAARERAVTGEPRELPLATAVAQSYAKLLAVKDEYEVARLYTDGEFRKQIESEFEGDYRIELHLAPPRMPVIDWFLDRKEASTGRTKKIAFGSWIFAFLGVLARFKFLRGTPFDPFGRVAHRRLERQLARDYEARVEELVDGLSRDNLDVAVEIAKLPEHVRGFESVKERALEAARAKEEELLASFRLKSGAAA